MSTVKPSVAVRGRLVKMLKFHFLLLTFSVLVSCAVTAVSIDVETSSLLPTETAIEFLNVNTKCRFFTYGVEIYDRKIFPYENTDYVVLKTGKVWSVWIKPKNETGVFVDDVCFLIEDNIWDGASDYNHVVKIVTAITSLGVEPNH